MVRKGIFKFEETDSVPDDLIGMKTNQKTSRAPENKTIAKIIVGDEQSTSAQNLAQQLNISAATAGRINTKTFSVSLTKFSFDNPRPRCY